MRLILHDLRQAGRRLARAPLFTTFSVAIVAVGVGANAAAFAVVDEVLLEPPAYEDAERVVRVYQDSDDGQPSSSSFPAYRDMAAFTGVFSEVAAWAPATFPMETDRGTRTVSVEFATSSYARVLGLEPTLGRWFDQEHDRVGAGAFAVVSHRSWRTLLGGDPGVVGGTIRLNGHPVTIVGVGPEGFHGSADPLVTDFWLSISSAPVGGAFRVANLERRQDHWYDVTARLAPGVTVAEAQAAMDGLALRLARDYPDLNRGRQITVLPSSQVRIHPEVDGMLVPAAAVVMGVVGLVLLLACSNLANLLLVRGVARAPEIAVRRALGATRSRVAGLFLGEAAIISLLGGAGGLLLARWIVTLVPRLPLPFPAVLDVDLDGRVVGFTLVLALATALLFGLIPALRARGWDLAGTLRDEAASTSPGRGRSLFRDGLVAVQVAVSLVLLVGAGLLTRSLVETWRVDPGVDPERVGWALASFRQAELDAAGIAALHRHIRDRLRALPGVEEAALTTRLPLSGSGTSTTVVEGHTPRVGTEAVELPVAVVSRGYWETLGIPLLAGRLFGAEDGPEAPRAVIVNRTAARRYWGGAKAAVGRRMRPQSDPDGWMRVVGVVGDVKVRSLQEPPTAQMYLHLPQSGATTVYALARTDGNPASILGPLRDGIREVGGSILVQSSGTLTSSFGDALGMPLLAAALLGGLSVLALILASVGVYAVVAFSVARRTGEMGIRIALGAERGGVVRLVVGEILATVMVGVAAGGVLAAVAAPSLSGLLFRVPAVDPVTFGAVGALLVAVALLAAYLPARRAAAADPLEALRAR